jgi:hypothetical protein
VIRGMAFLATSHGRFRTGRLVCAMKDIAVAAMVKGRHARSRNSCCQ